MVNNEIINNIAQEYNQQCHDDSLPQIITLYNLCSITGHKLKLKHLKKYCSNGSQYHSKYNKAKRKEQPKSITTRNNLAPVGANQHKNS